MTTQSILFTEGYIQEQSHNAPQVALSMSSAAPPSCCGTNMMSVSMDPSVIFQLEHNTSYKIYVKARVTGFRMAMPPEPLTPYDVEQTAYVTGNNLHFTSSPNYVIAWDPASMSSISISSAWDDEQTGTCSLTYNIYSTGGGVVYTKQFTGQSRPGNNSWSWDGKDSQGATVDKGLYTVKATVTSNIPTVSSDCNLSSYLSIQAPAGEQIEYYGYDDNGTPNDTSDDNYMYYIKCYKLADSGNINASEGVIKLYDPELQYLMEWDIEDLHCRIHDAYDGLNADSTGIEHDVLLKVPISMITSDDIYRFVAHVRDSHANDYKNHANKWAVDRNGTTEKTTPPVIIEVNSDSDFLPTINNSTQVSIKITNAAGVTMTGAKMPITVKVTPSHRKSVCCNYAEQASEVYTQGSSNKPKADFVWASLGSATAYPDRTAYNDSISATIYSSLDTARPQGALTYANGNFTINLSSYDYGGRMKVEISPPANRPYMKTIYKNDPSKTKTYMWVPWDYDEDRLADKWEIDTKTNLTSLTYNTDNDNSPNTPDSNTGDGYYAFEEYRGFMVNGTHVRTNPNIKDLFMRSSLGYGNVADATGFNMHYTADGSEDEMTDNQIMTANCYIAPQNECGDLNHHNQKGLRVIDGIEVIGHPNRLGEAPWGTPNDSGLVTVYTLSVHNLFPNDYDEAVYHIITHEAGHCIRLTPNGTHHHPDLSNECVMYGEPDYASLDYNVFCQNCYEHMRLH